MKLLGYDGVPVSRRLLSKGLAGEAQDVIEAADGQRALVVFAPARVDALPSGIFLTNLDRNQTSFRPAISLPAK
jgi:CheY-like chemotaxis protein